MRYTSASVHQLKNRKGKPWQARLKYKDPTGKWKETSKMLPDATGKREAERLAREWMDELNRTAGAIPNTPYRKKDRQTVGEVVKNYLDYQLSTGQIEESTHYQDIKALNRRINPYIGDILFRELDRVAIMNWITTLSQDGLKQATITGYISIVKKVYAYYHMIGEIPANPFEYVKHSSGKDRRKTHLTAEQMDNLITCIYEDFTPDHYMYPAIFLAFYGGLRRQEICALRWNDVDMERGLLTVSSAIGDGRKGFYTKVPKTPMSYRTFPMIPQLQEVLKEVYQVQQPENNWYVCGNRTKYLNPDTFSSAFQDWRDRHDLEDAYGKKVTSHGLRHNLGAVGIRSGMDIASLSLMFGHASRSMTLDIYGDANEDAKLVGAQKLSATFQKEMDEAQGYSEEE